MSPASPFLRAWRALLAAATAFLLGATVFGAEDGVTHDRIRLGQAAALDGAAEALGQGMQAGLRAAFHRTNAAGGVHGRTIELTSVNDGYEPERTAVATHVLLERTKVFALIGAVGTPTSRVALPICVDAKVPFIAPFTGAELLRSPHTPYAINLRASYRQETEELAKHLVDEHSKRSIACLYQNDAFGQSGLGGIRAALEHRGMRLVAEASFERNTLAVREALTTIAAAKPDAIILIGPYKPCAEFIRHARKETGTAASTFATISFVGTEALGRELGADGDGVVISQVMPSPADTSLPVVREYIEDMRASGAESQIGYVSLEGYLAGRLFVRTLEAIDGEPTRERFLETLTGAGPVDLGGFTVDFGPRDNQGSDDVFLTVLRDGRAEPLCSHRAVSAGVR